MTISLLCTTDRIGSTSGAGQVATNELKSMSRVFDDVKVLDGTLLQAASYNIPSDPFFIDYVASEMVRAKQFKIDIVHLNGDPFARTVEDVKKLNPSAKSIADCPAHELRESIREWEDVYGMYPFKHMTNSFLLNLYTLHIRTADMVVVPSIMSKKWLKKNLKIDNFTLIRHGTNIPTYKKLPSNYVVGYIGAIGPDKGLKYLFTAWKHFTDKGKLSLAGAHTPNLMDWKKAVLSSNSKSNIEILGFVDNKWNFLDSISVYVQPSVTEGFGIPILEAMAAGRPVIASKGAGASEIVKDGKHGLLFEPRDVQKLLEHIQYFHDNPSEIKKMGDAARKQARKYTWKKAQNKYVKLYKEMLK